jgi:tRNA nucleotidyltransferase/poly(A) polymerase
MVVDVASFRGRDLAADLADRDFTINALAADVQAPDRIIDHHGGLCDLEAGRIRPVSGSSIRNDPVRALRAVRQAGELGFALAPETLSLARRDGPALVHVSAERVRDEVARLLMLTSAAPLLEQLDRLGLLGVVFPELAPLRGMAQSPPHHLDVLDHSMATVQALESLFAWARATDAAPGTEPRIQGAEDNGPWVPLNHYAERIDVHVTQMVGGERARLVTLKLAALLHDTGKPTAHTVDDDGRIRFIGHEQESARLTGQVLRRLRFTRAEVQLADTVIRHHLRPILLADLEVDQGRTTSPQAVYRFYRDTGAAGIDVLLHALADRQATHTSRSEESRSGQLVSLTARMMFDYWERGAERVQPPALIDGHDLMQAFDLEPGPIIGELLEMVREAQVSGALSTRGEALALVSTYMASAR